MQLNKISKFYRYKVLFFLRKAVGGLLIFITGGVRSGKSSFAEQVASELVSPFSKTYYVATSMPIDEEMTSRIHKHQKDREKQKVDWVTIEKPRNLHELVGMFKSTDVVLIDCLTNLLNNELFDEWKCGVMKWAETAYREQIYKKIRLAIHEILKMNSNLIIVSNEVFYESFSELEEGTYYFAELLGKLHQTIVQQADVAYLVENGIPIVMKGSSYAERSTIH